MLFEGGYGTLREICSKGMQFFDHGNNLRRSYLKYVIHKTGKLMTEWMW